MSVLEKVKARARKLEIGDTILLSTRKNKRFKFLTPENKWIHFGDKTANTFLDHGDKKRRASYLARAKGIKNKNGEYTYKIKYTPNYLSYHLLWL